MIGFLGEALGGRLSRFSATDTLAIVKDGTSSLSFSEKFLCNILQPERLKLDGPKFALRKAYVDLWTKVEFG